MAGKSGEFGKIFAGKCWFMYSIEIFGILMEIVPFFTQKHTNCGKSGTLLAGKLTFSPTLFSTLNHLNNFGS